MPTENHTTPSPRTRAERFEKLGIVTLADLLCHYPADISTSRSPYSIAEAPADVECVVKAEVFAKPGRRILPERAADGAHHCRGRCVQSGDHMVQ